MIQSKLLRRFLSIERQLFKARDSRELLNRIVKEAVSLLDVDCASIYRYNEKERTLTWEATFGIDEKDIDIKGVPLSLSKSAVKAYRTKKPVAVIDTKKEKAIPAILVKRFGFRSSLTVPLLNFKRKVIGFLFIDIIGKTKRFTADELLIAEYFSNFASIAIEHARISTGLKKTVSILSAYDEISKSSVHMLEIDKFMKSILRNSIRALEMDGGVIQVFEEGHLVIKSNIGGTKKLAQSFGRIKPGKTTTGKVWKIKKPIIIEDAATDRRITKESRTAILGSGYRSIFSVPMMADDEVRGVLTVAAKEKKVYRQHEIDFFVNVGKQVGVMLENALLFERMELSRKKIKALVELNRSTVSILELPLLYQQVLGELPSIIPCYSASILLTGSAGKELKVVSAYGPRKKQREKFSTRIGKGITGRVARTGKPTNVPDVRKSRYYIEELPEIRSELSVPLVRKGKIIGVLNVESNKTNAYTDDDLALLSAFGNELAIAIENARLYQESKERTAQLELINRVVKKIGLTLDIDSLCKK